MLQSLREKFNAFKKSDKLLDYGIRTSAGIALLCAGGVGLWGGLTAIGIAALAIKAAGVGIPAIIGYSTLTTGVLMCAKSLVFNRVFSFTHKKLMKVKETRDAAKGTPPAPPAPPAAKPLAALAKSSLAKAQKLKATFNHEHSADAKPAANDAMNEKANRFTGLLQKFKNRGSKPAA
ncbi:MAG: hypothetical protein PW788_01710 [Micavibrio sp.]|nr:hypothetical protein [Micavibrio sp.]